MVTIGQIELEVNQIGLDILKSELLLVQRTLF